MSIAKAMERLDARERRLLGGLTAVVLIFVVVLIPFGTRTMLSGPAERTTALRQAIDELVSSQAVLAKADLRRNLVTKRYANPAPPLAGLLDGMAKESGIEIPESQDRPVVPHGKRFEERSTRLQMRKVGLGNLARFLEKVEQSGHPVVVSKLNVRKRLTEPDSFDVELIVSAYDRKEVAKSETPADAEKVDEGSAPTDAKEEP